MVETRNAYQIFIKKSKGKRQLMGTSHIWEFNIQMYLEDLGCEDVN
jgi:hypothetical protein